MSAAEVISSQTSFSNDIKCEKKDALDGGLILYSYKCKEVLPATNTLQFPKSLKDQSMGGVNNSKSDRTAGNGQTSIQGSDISVPYHLKGKLSNLDSPLKKESSPLNFKASGLEAEKSKFSSTLRFAKKIKAIKNLISDSKKRVGSDFDDSLLQTSTNFLFDVADSEKLHSLGGAFYKKFKKGQKHFSFSSMGAESAQKRSIVGIATFMNYFEPLNILIVTGDMDKSIFSEIRRNPLKIKKNIPNLSHQVNYDIFHHQGLNFLEVETISSIFRSEKLRGRENVLKELLKEYDVVFYDLPKVNERKSNYEIYFSLYQLIDEVTLTLTLKKNTFKDVEQADRYFNKHSIVLAGCILDDSYVKVERKV